MYIFEIDWVPDAQMLSWVWICNYLQKKNKNTNRIDYLILAVIIIKILKV